MLHIKYELKQDNDNLVAEISSSMTKTNTKEVEYCIAYLIDIIKKNDKKMRNNSIINDVKKILNKLEKEKIKNGK